MRDPDGFVAAVARAQEKGIPVVVDKVARTDASAALAATHSGAIAGSDTAFGAVCDAYGVIRCADLDEMIWKIPEQIAILSRSMALKAGDLIYSGTPAGVGPLVPGDVCEIEIEGLGRLKTTIGPRV